MAPTEIKALARIIGDLDYYQLLHLGRDAEATDVKRAYHASSRAFHPDANRHLHGELLEAVQVIAKRVSEAYSVLRDPKRRQAYDRRLEAGGGVRIQLAEARAEAGRQATEELTGRTPQGRQFHKLAQGELQKNNLQGAARHLQTALTFEADNEHFKALLADIRKQLR